MRSKFISLLLLVLLTCGAEAQKAYVRMGDMYFKQFDFKTAIKYYARAIKKDSSNVHVKQNIADSYRHLNDWVNAEPWYAKLAGDQTANPQDKMYYAEALRANQKYTEAKVAYKDYMAAAPSDVSVKERLAGVDKVADLSKDRGLYTIENLPINSPKSDFGPSFYTNGQIFFCSNRDPLGRIRLVDDWTGASFLKLYIGKPDANGNITTSEEMKGHNDPNGKYHEGPADFNEKLQELYITRSNYKKARAFTSSDKTVKLKLYRLVFLPNENRWGDQLIEAVPFNDREYSVGHAALTKDGQTLYFASDKAGGYGGVDIYKSVRDQSGNWTVPVNLGPNINTSGDEMFPFVADEGTLYFASNGHIGLGGLDVFSTTPVGKDGWSTPENLGYPINTNFDDFGYIIDKSNKNGYFVSNRPGGQGDDDIYKFVKKGIEICGLVYDAKTNDPIEGAKVVMYEVKDEKGNKMTGKDGNFCFAGSPQRVYKFVATKTGYLPNEVTVETNDKPSSLKIPMVKEGGINLEVLVLDKKTREPIDMANVRLVNTATSKEEKQQTNPDGKAYYSLEPNATYRIEGSKDLPDPEMKYLAVSTTTSTVGKTPPATIYVTLELEKVKKGVAIKIENIYYDLDKWFIRPDAAKELDKLVKVMQDNPTMEIELSSHTDCRATIKYNATLSAKRAEAAVQYIASRGVSLSRMIAAGYGESRLVNKCACEGTFVVPCTEEQHQENRRTEFKILKF